MIYKEVEELLKYNGKTVNDVVKIDGYFRLIFTDGTFLDIEKGAIGYEDLRYLLMQNGELIAA